MFFSSELGDGVMSSPSHYIAGRMRMLLEFSIMITTCFIDYDRRLHAVCKHGAGINLFSPVFSFSFGQGNSTGLPVWDRCMLLMPAIVMVGGAGGICPWCWRRQTLPEVGWHARKEKTNSEKPQQIFLTWHNSAVEMHPVDTNMHMQTYTYSCGAVSECDYTGAFKVKRSLRHEACKCGSDSDPLQIVHCALMMS